MADILVILSRLTEFQRWPLFTLGARTLWVSNLGAGCFWQLHEFTQECEGWSVEGEGGLTTLKDLSPIVSEIMNLFITWFKPHSLLLPDRPRLSLYTVSDNPLCLSAPQVTFISQTWELPLVQSLIVHSVWLYVSVHLHSVALQNINQY